MAFDLPPTLEAVRLALAAPPPAFFGSLPEVPKNSGAGAFERDHMEKLKTGEALVQAGVEHIRAVVSEAQAAVARGDEGFTSEAMERAVEEAGKALTQALEILEDTAQSRGRIIEVGRLAGLGPTAKKIGNTMLDLAQRYHDGIEAGYIALRALAADVNPESRVLTGEISTSAELEQFFFSMRRL